METKNIISLIGEIRRSANNLILNELKSRGLDQLSTSHGDILARLQSGRELPMKEIAGKINRKKNTVTVLVEKLIQLGFVQKTVSREDSRVILVSLTPEGRELMPDFEAISQRLIDRTYRGFSERERQQVIGFLNRIKENLKTESFS